MNEQEFEIKKCRFNDQAEFLRFNTRISLQILGGALAAHILLGKWIIDGNLCNEQGIWVLFIDFLFTIVSCIMLLNMFKRRQEAIEELKYLKDVLKMEKKKDRTCPYTWIFCSIICIYFPFGVLYILSKENIYVLIIGTIPLFFAGIISFLGISIKIKKIYKLLYKYFLTVEGVIIFLLLVAAAYILFFYY